MFLKSEKDTLSTFVNSKFVSPGPTYYCQKSAFDQKNKIVTGSLYGPKQINNELGKFGTATRFRTTNQDTPGPAAYKIKEPTYKHNPTNRVAAPPKPFSKPSHPSIPTSRNNIGKILSGATEDEVEEQTEAVKLTRNAPAYSFPRSQYDSRQPAFVQPQYEAEVHVDSNNSEFKLEGQFKLDSVNQLQSIKDKELDAYKQQNERRKKELLDMVIGASTVPSLELLQMRKKFLKCEIPGPGSYVLPQNVDRPTIFGNLTGAFASQLDRFQTKDEFPQQYPGKYSLSNLNKPTTYKFNREPRGLTNNLKSPSQPFICYAQLKPKTFRKSAEPFGSGVVRFSRSVSQSIKIADTPVKMKNFKTRKAKKSISTVETMESDNNLQSIDVLFHMYGNS